MLDHRGSLAVGQRSFGEGGEHVRVRMIDGGRRGLQPIEHDFGDGGHLTFELLLSLTKFSTKRVCPI
jgi:hypothetical protein